jgi:drug/metabolite transporter (DMT)-like permease
VATPPAPTDAARRAVLGLLVVVAIWGLNFPVIKVPLEVLPPFAVNALRFAFSTLTLGAIWTLEARRHGKDWLGPMRERPWAILALGVLGHLTYQVLFILGIARTPAGTAALLIASSPLWTALVGHFGGVDRLSRRAALSLLVCTAGVVVVVLGEAGGPQLGGALVGSLLMLAGGGAWGLYTVYTRPVLAGGMAPMGLTFFSVAAAAPLLLALGAPDLAAQDWSTVGWEAWAALVFSGALSTGLAYALWNEGIRIVGPSRTAAFSNLVPFVALLASYVMLGEAITPAQVLGGALIVGGLVLLRRR